MKYFLIFIFLLGRVSQVLAQTGTDDLKNSIVEQRQPKTRPSSLNSTSNTSNPMSVKKPITASKKQEEIKTEEPAILNIRALPYISIINADNLVTYKWWEAENKKVPEVYKNVLKKIVHQLKEKNIHLGFNFVTVKEFSADTVHQLVQNNTQYLISGQMLFDVEKPDEFILKDIKVNSLADPLDVFIPESSKDIVNLEQVGQWARQMEPFFRKDKVMAFVDEPQLFVQFKNTFIYQEIEKIITQIQTEVTGVKGFKIYSFSGNEVTFSVRPASEALIQEISRLHFLKGPYKKEFTDKTLILTPMTEEDFESTSKQQLPTN